MREVVLPKFDKEYTEACVIEGEDLLTLRLGCERYTEAFVNTGQIPKEKMGTGLNGRRLGCAVPGALPIDLRRRMV